MKTDILTSYEKLIITMTTMIIVLLIGGCAAKRFPDRSVDSYEDCQSKGGIWYNDQCWKDFQEEDNLLESEVDDYVNTAMKAIESSAMVWTMKDTLFTQHWLFQLRMKRYFL